MTSRKRTSLPSASMSRRCHERTLMGDVDPHQTPVQRSPLPLEEAAARIHPFCFPLSSSTFDRIGCFWLVVSLPFRTSSSGTAMHRLRQPTRPA